MELSRVASRRNLLWAVLAAVTVAMVVAAVLGGPFLIGPFVLICILAGIVRLISGWLSRRVARLRLSIRWKILGAIALMSALMIAISIVSIVAMDYMHTELHDIQELRSSALVFRAVDELEAEQHGFFFSFAPLIAVLASLAAVTFGIAIAVSVISPVKQIGDAMRRIAAGDFSQPVTVENRDELGDLAVRINEMAGELASLQEAALAEERARSLKEQVTHVTRAQEEERGRISRELHDGLGPSLAAAVNRLRAVQRMIANDPLQAESELEDITQGLKGNIQDIRDLIHDLRPLALDQLGLQGALQQQLNRFEQMAGVTLSVGIDQGIFLDPLSEVTVFRVLQECLGNIEKHSGARSVEVLLRCGDDSCWLSVSDDGVGFNPARTGNGRSEGVGILGMRERAELIGGTLSVDARPGRGTCVVLKFPRRGRGDVEKEEELGAHPSLAG